MVLFFDPRAPTCVWLAVDCPIPEGDREECEAGQQSWVEMLNIFFFRETT